MINYASFLGSAVWQCECQNIVHAWSNLHCSELIAFVVKLLFMISEKAREG
jgi:hypothetical protein